MKFIIKHKRFKLVQTKGDKGTFICIKKVDGMFFNKLHLQVSSFKLILVFKNK